MDRIIGDNYKFITEKDEVINEFLYHVSKNIRSVYPRLSDNNISYNYIRKVDNVLYVTKIDIRYPEYEYSKLIKNGEKKEVARILSQNYKVKIKIITIKNGVVKTEDIMSKKEKYKIKNETENYFRKVLSHKKIRCVFHFNKRDEEIKISYCDSLKGYIGSKIGMLDSMYYVLIKNLIGLEIKRDSIFFTDNNRPHHISLSIN